MAKSDNKIIFLMFDFMKKISWKNLERDGVAGRVVLLPTDTVWGLHAAVDDEGARRRIVKLKKRNPKKGFIILLARMEDLAQFGVDLNFAQKAVLRKLWAGRVTVVLNSPLASGQYRALSLDGETLAFRVPASRNLRKLLAVTGPLTSTSANISGNSQSFDSSNIPPEISAQIDFCVASRKELSGEPSAIIKFLR